MLMLTLIFYFLDLFGYLSTEKMKKWGEISLADGLKKPERARVFP